MKKTKYLVLSAAAILAVGCGSNKMPQISEDETYSTAEAIGKEQTSLFEKKELPEKLTVTKNYHESYESNFSTGHVAWTDDESYKLEFDLTKKRLSFEIKDSDTSEYDDEEYSGPEYYSKIDVVYENGHLYQCLNFNNILIGKEDMGAMEEEDAENWLKELLYINEEGEPVYVIEVPYMYADGELDTKAFTGPLGYLTGARDLIMDYIIEVITQHDVTPTYRFPGYLAMVLGEGEQHTGSIINSVKTYNDLIKKGGTYTDGSYANCYFGSNDKKTSLYSEASYKLGYIVDRNLDDRSMGNEAFCDYKTDMNFTYVDSHISKSSISHTQNMEYRLLDQPTGEYKNQTLNETVEIKLEANIADIKVGEYPTLEDK